MSIDNKIQKFWNWFVENEVALIVAIEEEGETKHFVSSLDNLILDIGKFSWEIGPSINGGWSLTISPNGDKDLLHTSQTIMDNSPQLTKWEFYHSKPPKRWEKRFTVHDDLMNSHEIDASKWNYVALKYNDQMVGLILEANNITHLGESIAKTAGDILVEGELGEETKINKIATIEVVAVLDAELQSKKTAISYLKDHFIKF